MSKKQLSKFISTKKIDLSENNPVFTGVYRGSMEILGIKQLLMIFTGEDGFDYSIFQSSALECIGGAEIGHTIELRFVGIKNLKDGKKYKAINVFDLSGSGDDSEPMKETEKTEKEPKKTEKSNAVDKEVSPLQGEKQPDKKKK